MKKQLIKEAFRLQQIAGLRPVNELFGDANPDALKLDEGTIRRYFETMVESQPETVVNILTQLMTEKLPFNQFLHDTVEDISDSYRDELGETEGLQEEQMGQETLNLKAESTGGGTYYISIVSSYGTDIYLKEETFNSYEECLISVIEDGGGDTDDLNPEEHDIEFLEKKLDDLIEEHDGEWTVASIIGKNEGKLYVGP